MNWIKRHWELVIPLILSSVLAIFELSEHLRHSNVPMPAEAFFWISLVYLVGISSQLFKLDKPMVDRTMYQLYIDYADGNPYLEDHIKSTVTRLKTGLESREFSTIFEGQSDKELVRALRICKHGDSVNAISYRVPWMTTFHSYHAENLAAAKRGVTITRIFVISDFLLDSRNIDVSTNLWDVMKQQSGYGIKVKYINQNQIPRTTDLSTRDRGMVEFRYGTKNSLVMYETASSPLQGDRRKPLLVMVSWKSDQVSDEHDHFEWLSNLPHLHDVGSTTDLAIPPWIKRKSAGSAG